MTKLRQIYLCGFMGAGKSTLLNRLNPPSGIKLYDLDELLLSEVQEKSVGAFVDKFGWTEFRVKENELLLNKLQGQESFVMALGGGSLSLEVVQVLNERATLIWLATPLEICLERIFLEEKKRPLVKEGRAFLEKLYAEREPLYRLSRFHLFAQNQEQIRSYVDLLEFIKN